jgi:hypothetical protein
MSFTQTDLDAINRAIATGELTVRTASGQSVTYRSVAELEQARRLIEADLSRQQGQLGRVRPLRYSGF